MCGIKIFCVLIFLCIPVSFQFSNLRRILLRERVKNDEKTELQIILEEFGFENPFIVKSINFVDIKQLKDFFLNNQLVRLCKTIHEIPKASFDPTGL